MRKMRDTWKILWSSLYEYAGYESKNF